MVTRKYKEIYDQIPKSEEGIDSAIKLIKSFAKSKFDETVEIAMNLGIDPSQSDQVVKGFSYLPHGIGKKVRVAVVTKDERFEEAKSSGADVFGSESLIEDMGKGNLDYDVIIATPDIMPLLSKIGRVLGPKKLMPNPKFGTVTDDISGTVKNIKSGQVNFGTEKGGIIHAAVGKVSFSEQSIKENVLALVSDVVKLKPATSKGVFVKKVSICSTMGPSISLVVSELL